MVVSIQCLSILALNFFEGFAIADQLVFLLGGKFSNSLMALLTSHAMFCSLGEGDIGFCGLRFSYDKANLLHPQLAMDSASAWTLIVAFLES